MKKLTKDYANKSVKELEKEAQSVRAEITKLKLGQKANPQKDTNAAKKMQKKLAVILTVLTEVKLKA